MNSQVLNAGELLAQVDMPTVSRCGVCRCSKASSPDGRTCIRTRVDHGDYLRKVVAPKDGELGGWRAPRGNFGHVGRRFTYCYERRIWNHAFALGCNPAAAVDMPVGVILFPHSQQ